MQNALQQLLRLLEERRCYKSVFAGSCFTGVCITFTWEALNTWVFLKSSFPILIHLPGVPSVLTHAMTDSFQPGSRVLGRP